MCIVVILYYFKTAPTGFHEYELDTGKTTGAKFPVSRPKQLCLELC